MDTSIDAVALHHLFTLHAVVPAPRTIYNGIRKLAPGTTLTVNARGELRHRRYWSLQAQRPATPKTEAEWQEAIHDSLRQAVKKRIEIADVKVGVLLSGGLDSSLLVALLAEQGVPDLMTFSVGFEDQPEERGNEFEYSDPVAAMYGTRHHKYLIPNSEVLRRLPEAVDAMSEPMFAQDAVAFYLLAEQVSKTVKVVQSGQGADEVFGGYFWYPRMAAETEGSALDRFRRHYFDRDHDEFLELAAPAYHGPDYTAQTVAAHLAEPFADEFIDQVLRMDVTMLITDDPVKRVDNMTMAWGLEARVPFLDHQLVELAAQMPPATEARVRRQAHPQAHRPRPDSRCRDRPQERLLPDARAEVRARRVSRLHARHSRFAGLPRARPVSAGLCGQAARRAGAASHPHPGQQAVASGAA